MTESLVMRYLKLRKWMDSYGLGQRYVAELLGMKPGSITNLLRAETIRTVHFHKLTGAGFPADLLPLPLDKPRGRPPKVPLLP